MGPNADRLDIMVDFWTVDVEKRHFVTKPSLSHNDAWRICQNAVWSMHQQRKQQQIIDGLPETGMALDELGWRLSGVFVSEWTLDRWWILAMVTVGVTKKSACGAYPMHWDDKTEV